MVQKPRDEIAILEGRKPRPTTAPRRLGAPPPKPPRAGGAKRPGPQERPKKAVFLTPQKQTVPFPDRPAGARSGGCEGYFVQGLAIHGTAALYLRERIATAGGRHLLAPSPGDVLPGSHFGPELIAYVLDQHHQRGVTQPPPLEQSLGLGVAISSGQPHNILTENRDRFHQEKAEIPPTAPEVSSYAGVDDTGARHGGHGGCRTASGRLVLRGADGGGQGERGNTLLHRQPGDDGRAIRGGSPWALADREWATLAARRVVPEDDSRTQKRNGAADFAMPRKIALSLLKRHPSDDSINRERCAAALDTASLEEFITSANKLGDV